MTYILSISSKHIIFLIFSTVDEYGFERHEDFDYESYEHFMSVYLKVLASRAQKWATLLGEGKSVKRTNTVKRYVRKGIPSKYIKISLKLQNTITNLKMSSFFLILHLN